MFPKLSYYLSKLRTLFEIYNIKVKMQKSNQVVITIKLKIEILKFIIKIISLKFKYLKDLSKS